jgi:transcriptional regulator with XRE-family HTH domain
MPVRRSAPTSQDVARLAGVSQSTVSYVLTGSRPISAATRRRVEEAIEKLGYHPNSGARALRSRRSGVIGLMVPEAYGNDAVLMRFVGAIAREAQRFGYDILLVTAQEGARGIHRVVRTGVCEALILMELGRHDERVAAVIEAGLPFVLIGKPVGFPNGSVVDLDFERLGRMVVDRAADEGCERLLLFGEPGHRRHRNDVSRFLLGIEEQAQGRGLEVVLDAGDLPDVPARARDLARGGQAHGRVRPQRRHRGALRDRRERRARGPGAAAPRAHRRGPRRHQPSARTDPPDRSAARGDQRARGARASPPAARGRRLPARDARGAGVGGSGSGGAGEAGAGRRRAHLDPHGLG